MLSKQPHETGVVACVRSDIPFSCRASFDFSYQFSMTILSL
jgi:hypothetical protein